MSKRRQAVGVFLTALMVLLVSCGPVAAPALPPPAPAPQLPVAAAPAPSAPTKAAWEAEWEKVQAGARQEGQLTVAISAVGRQLTTGFQNRFEIRAESMSAQAGALASKILAEQRAGLFLWDVFIGGAGTQLSMFKPAGASVPLESTLILPDLTDPEVIKNIWYGGKFPWVDRDHYVAAPFLQSSPPVAVNSNLVKPGEFRALEDLLNPKWKGKMLLPNPTLSGFISTNLLPWLYETKGEGWVRKLAQQEPVIVPDARLALEWLAHGKYPVLISPRTEDLKSFLDAGAPIAAVQFEDVGILSTTSGPVSLVRNAPHPSAAKLFINWYLSLEGQTIMAKGLGSQSARLDVSTEGISTYTLRKPNVNYYIQTEESLIKVDAYKMKSKEIFGVK